MPTPRRKNYHNLLALCRQCHMFGVIVMLAQHQQQQAQAQQQQQNQAQQQQQPQVQTQSLTQSQQQQLLSQAEVISAIESIGIGALPGHGQGSSSNGSVLARGGSGGNFLIQFIHSEKDRHFIKIDPVNFTNLHEPRIELRYQPKLPFVSIDERTPNNTVVAAVVVSDEDNGPNGETSLSIEHGNELGHFKLVSTHYTNTIQVSGAPLSKRNVPEYNLTIVAKDHGSPPRWSAVNLVIKLNTSQPPFINPQLEPQPSLKPPVTDFMSLGVMLVAIFIAVIIFLIIGCALVKRPKGKKGPPPRTTSATNSRIHQNHHDHYLCIRGQTNF